MLFAMSQCASCSLSKTRRPTRFTRASIVTNRSSLPAGGSSKRSERPVDQRFKIVTAQRAMSCEASGGRGRPRRRAWGPVRRFEGMKGGAGRLSAVRCHVLLILIACVILAFARKPGYVMPV